MLLHFFSIYDCKSESYMQPFLVRNKGEAIRGFSDLCNDGKSSVSQHPADYTLFHIGTFDDNTGSLNPLASPVSCGVGIEFVRSSNAPAVLPLTGTH